MSKITNLIKKLIYLDLQATTPVDPRVLNEMMPYFTTKFGNAHSKTHQYGWDSEESVENARKKISNIINANPKEIPCLKFTAPKG